MSGLPSAEHRREVLVVHPGSLGDVVLAVPSLRAVRRLWPGRAVVLLARGDIAELLRHCGEVDHAFDVTGSCWASLWTTTGPVPQGVRDRLRACDAAVAWLSPEQTKLAQRLAGEGVPEVRIGSPHGARLRCAHQADRYAEAVGILLQEAERSVLLSVPAWLAQEAIPALGGLRIDSNVPRIVVHPGSGSPYKCVSSTRLIELVHVIQGQGWTPLLIAGPADHEIVGRLVEELGSGVPVLRDLPLATAAGVLLHASVFVGHDSGLTHLSTALGIPTIAMFGPTDPGRWAPRGKSVFVIRGAACACEGWTAVARCGERHCLTHSPSEILAACLRAVEVSEAGRSERPWPRSSPCPGQSGCAKVTN
jgi:ADP-heptose:LPS heptosyltransferase